MHQVTHEHIRQVLYSLGIQPGDSLLVHSAIQFLGRPEGGIGIYFDAICEMTNCESGIRNRDPQSLVPDSQSGTIAVPTFTFGFARGAAYDPQVTPSTGMGSFAEFVRTQPGARRTLHPLQSLAAAGPYAADLASRDTPSAFDPGSAFERLLELDFKLLLLGANIQAVSMVHYSEQRAGVPYRYWKDFTGQVHTPTGVETRTYRMFVRDLDLNPQLDLHPIQRSLESSGLWRSASLNYGQVAVCRLVDFVAAANRLLAADPWALVSNPPS